MAAKDLITLARAYYNLQGQSNDSLVTVLITAASDAIEKYCKRDFFSHLYDELYNGTGQRRLLLREYPITSVQSVRYRPVTVLKVTNTDAANVQARVSVSATGIALTRTNAGAVYNEGAIAFSTYTSISALAAAISAVGNGWSAQYVGDSNNYGSWLSSDLYWPTSFPASEGGSGGQGALSCVAGSFAELKMHTYELQGFQWDPRGWLLRAIPYTDPELLHPEDLVWPTGINNFRIQYTAGYATIPEAVQEACAEWVAALYWATQRDPALKTQTVASAVAQTWAQVSTVPAGVTTLLAPYRRHTIGLNQS